MLAVYKHSGSLIRYNIIDSLDVVQSIAVDSISNIYAAGFTNRYNTVHKYNPSGILRWRAVTSQNPFMYKILFAKPDIFYTCGRDRFSPTYKFYFVKFKLNPGSSSPLGEKGIAESKSFRLDDNYPNPFNPSTTIKFALPVGGVTTLKVYDIAGKEVASLVETDLEAGYHEVNFNASELSSGVYFYRLTSGSFTDVKKMMLVK
ncbi:MAG: T9SS type A sorting domain-containing protein [Ignavibacteria bacterium]|nr:T9SS type A sorting domain-containing protein [Ignavibacteria bacterium]